MNLPCGNSRGKGIAYSYRETWKHKQENLRENPEPNPASNGIEMGAVFASD